MILSYCSQIFDRIRTSNPNQLNKLICVAGDIAQPMIGLTESDVIKLTDNVNIVFHSAATVRFDQKLKDAANLNTLGSKRLWDLCEKMSQLKVFLAFNTTCDRQQFTNFFLFFFVTEYNSRIDRIHESMQTEC